MKEVTVSGVILPAYASTSDVLSALGYRTDGTGQKQRCCLFAPGMCRGDQVDIEALLAGMLNTFCSEQEARSTFATALTGNPQFYTVGWVQRALGFNPRMLSHGLPHIRIRPNGDRRFLRQPITELLRPVARDAGLSTEQLVLSLQEERRSMVPANELAAYYKVSRSTIMRRVQAGAIVALTLPYGPLGRRRPPRFLLPCT